MLYITYKRQRQLTLQLFPYCLWQVSAHSINVLDNIVLHIIGLHTGNPVPFLYTPTSLLPEHCVLTDVQQATGRNGQQWITCRSGEQRTRPKIWMGSNEIVLSSSTANFATIGLGTHYPNGVYHCWSAQSQRQYFSLYLRNSGTKHVTFAHPYDQFISMYVTLTECVQTSHYNHICLITSFLFSSHPINTNCKYLGQYMDPHIARWKQSGQIYCRV